MHYTGQVYRHPLESETPLLEVTIGCSHNSCTFCTMYRDTPFHISKVAHIQEDIKELASFNPRMERIYLLNADPFALSTNKLIQIGEMINDYLPQVKTITMYASINNIKNKSVEDLKMLRALGFNDLHIGIESADDTALKLMNKGFNKAEALIELSKLKEAGIRYDALLMLGIAGANQTLEAIKETVDFLNETKPYMISVMPTSIYPGSELSEMAKRGEYKAPSEREILNEEKYLLANTHIDNCFFFGSHINNLVPLIGNLELNRERMIKVLDQKLATIDSSILDEESITTQV